MAIVSQGLGGPIISPRMSLGYPAIDVDNIVLTIRGGWEDGVVIRPYSRTNYGHELTDVEAWTAGGAATVASTDPPTDSGLTAARVSDLQAGNAGFYYKVCTAPNGDRAPSIWMRPVSVSGNLDFSDPFDASYGIWTIDLSKLTAGWQRIHLAHPAVTQVLPWSNATNSSGLYIRAYLAGTLSVDISAPGMFDISGRHIYAPTAVTSGTDFRLVSNGNDGSIIIEVSRALVDSGVLEWTNASPTCSITMIDSTHYKLRCAC